MKHLVKLHEKVSFAHVVVYWYCWSHEWGSRCNQLMNG